MSTATEPQGPPTHCPTCGAPVSPSPASTGTAPVLAGASLDDEWLVSESARFESPHCYRAGDRRVRPVDLVVMHYTAAPWQEPSAERARHARWLQGQGRKSSTHFVILRTGEVLQGVPLSARAWHVVDEYTHNGRPVNYRSIAIDFASVGFLHRAAGGELRDDYNGKYRGPPPYIDARGRPWEPITAEQQDSAVRLLAALGRIFPALTEPDRLIYHSDVQRTRSDPGPTVDRAALARALRGQ